MFRVFQINVENRIRKIGDIKLLIKKPETSEHIRDKFVIQCDTYHFLRNLVDHIGGEMLGCRNE